MPSRRFSDTLRAFRVRNYRLYFIGQLTSQTGTWMQRVAQAWLVLDLTGSPLALGLVTTLQTAPVMSLALFGGVLADRVPKRKLLIVTQAVQMTQALAIAALATTGLIQLWHVYVLAVMLGLANAFDTPSRQSMLAELVGPEDLPNAVALNSMLGNSARIVGPSIAGLVIAAFGVTTCFWVNAASFLAVISALAALRPRDMYSLARTQGGRVLGQIKEGLSFALRTRDTCLVVILLGALGTFGFNFNTFVPLLARFVLETGPVGLGGLFTSQGAGAVFSALSLASRRQATERAMRMGALAFGLIFVAVAWSSTYAVTAGLMFLLGVTSTVFSSSANTRMQLASPPGLRGRVMSLYSLLFMGTTPIGAALIGTLSERFGVPATLTVCASVCLLGVAAAEVYAWRHPALRARAAP